MATTFTLKRKIFATVAIAGKSIAGMVQNRGASTMTKVAPGVKATGSTLGGKARTDYESFWSNVNLKNTNSATTNTVLGTATGKGGTRTITTGDATKADLKKLNKAPVSTTTASTQTAAPTPAPTTPPTTTNSNPSGLGWTGQGTAGQKQKSSNNNSSSTPNGWSKGKKWTVGILGTTTLATGYGLKKIDDAANGHN